MSAPVLVRAIARTDLAQWESLWEGYNDFYQRRLAPETTRITWSRFFDPCEPVHALVAQQGDRLLGLVHYLFHRSTITIEPTCYLQDLFTLEQARRQGVGRMLIEAVHGRATQAGAARVYWLTRDTNHASIQLYDKIASTSGLLVYRMPI